jgi:hypothetical protein
VAHNRNTLAPKNKTGKGESAYMRHVNMHDLPLNNCRPGNGAAFRPVTLTVIVCAAWSTKTGRHARPVDGLQSGQVIGGADLGNPRVAAPFFC